MQLPRPAILSLILFALLGGIPDARAERFQLQLPLRCDFAKDCYVQAYVDIDPGAGLLDHACGVITKHEHIGTDFRLRDFDLLEQGVAVTAAAAGTVRRVRDGVRDANSRIFGDKIARHKGMGNFVRIDHDGGWTTRYGHMRRGSVRVKPGDKVEAGQILGLVGLSGWTEFPHLHFEVYKNAKPIDPFSGRERRGRCGGAGGSIWDAEAERALNYRPRILTAAGFSEVPLNRAALMYGLHVRKHLSNKAENIVFNVDFTGLRKGDSYNLRILAPSGEVFIEKEETAEKDWPFFFKFLGKRRANRPQWPAGLYRGQFTLFREAGGKRQTFVEYEDTLRVD